MIFQKEIAQAVISFPILFGCWRILIFGAGMISIYAEYQNAKVTMSSPMEIQEMWRARGPYSDMKWYSSFPSQAPYISFYNFWMCLGLFLLLAGASMSPQVPELVVWSPIILLAAIIRFIYLRLTSLSPNKQKFLVGNAMFQLIGERGIIIKEVRSVTVGTVRMENPVFGEDDMECIADETIKSSEVVKVVEVDCGLLKVIRLIDF